MPFSRVCFPTVPSPLHFCSYFPFYPMSFNLLPISFSSSFFIVSSYLEYVSLYAPPIQPSTSLGESLHFGLVPSYCTFIFIYWLTVLVFSSPSSLGCYSCLFHTLAFVFSPGSAPGCLPLSSTKLRLFSRPFASVLFCIYLPTNCFTVFTSFLLSLCSYI